MLRPSLSPPLIEFLLALPKVLLLSLGCWALGRRFLGWLGADTQKSITAPAALVLGYAALAYLIFGLSLFSLLNPGILWGVWGIFSIYGFFVILSEAKNLWNSSALILRRFTPQNDMGNWIFFIGIFLLILGCAKPEIFYDSWVYHLGLPELFLTQGHAQPVSYHFFTVMPVLKEMLSVLGFALGGETAARLLAVFWSLGGVWALYAWTGAVPAALFLSTPLVFTNIRRMVNEPLMAAPLVLALYAILNPSWFKKDRSQAFAAGLFTGLLFALKYFSGPWCVLLFVLFVWQCRKFVSFFILGSVLPVLPWLIRSYAAFGDPLYPYLSMALGKIQPTQSWQIAMDQLQHWYPGLPRGLSDFMALVRGSFLDRTGSFFVGPAYAILLPIVFFFSKRSYVPLTVFLAFAWAASLSQSHYLRYHSPLLAPLALLIYLKASEIESAKGRKVFNALLSVFLVFNLFWMLYGFRRSQDQKAMLGVISREAYLENKLGYYWKALEWIQKNTPKEAKILVVGEIRAYGFQRRLIISTVHDRHPLADWLEEASDKEALRRRLAQEGITHVFLHHSELERLRGYHNFDLSPRAQKLWEDFLKDLPALYEDPGQITLYSFI